MSTTLPQPDAVRAGHKSFWARFGGRASRKYRLQWLDRLTPALPVRVLLVDGSEALWRQGEIMKPAAPLANASTVSIAEFRAVEYPEDRLLRRQLILPDMSIAEAADAAELDAVTSSPFRSGDLAWGHRCLPLASGKLQVDIVIASRKQIQQYLARLEGQLAGPKQPEAWAEVWALSSSAEPIVIQGFGEGRRVHRQKRHRWLLGSLFALTWGLLMGITVTPTAQLRLQAIQAVESFDTVHQRTAALALKRQSIYQAEAQIKAMNEVRTQSVHAVEVMGLLTRALPDDSSLLNLQIQGSKIRLTGQTTNTADLMQKLSAYPGLRDVKAPSAATRPLGANKESFTIELELTQDNLRQPQSSLGVLSSRRSESVMQQNASTP